MALHTYVYIFISTLVTFTSLAFEWKNIIYTVYTHRHIRTVACANLGESSDIMKIINRFWWRTYIKMMGLRDYTERSNAVAQSRRSKSKVKENLYHSTQSVIPEKIRMGYCVFNLHTKISAASKLFYYYYLIFVWSKYIHQDSKRTHNCNS